MRFYDSLAAIPQDKLADMVGGKFHLTRLISLRLKDIKNGAPLFVERKTNEALLAAVCREIEEGYITLETYEPVTTQDDAEYDINDILGINDEDL